MTPEQTDDFLETIAVETERLTAFLINLLDMSRLQAGAVQLVLIPIGLDGVVSRTLGTVRDDGRGVFVNVPESLPLVRADAGLLERSLANPIDNAVAHSPPGQAVVVDTSEHAGSVVGRTLSLAALQVFAAAACIAARHAAVSQ